MIDDEYIDKIVENLISLGLVEVVGIDPVSQEFLYKFSPVLSEIYPEINNFLGEDFLRQINSLWVKGFVDMDITSDSPLVSLKEDAFDEKRVASLTLEERNALFSVIDLMKQNQE